MYIMLYSFARKCQLIWRTFHHTFIWFQFFIQFWDFAEASNQMKLFTLYAVININKSTAKQQKEDSNKRHKNYIGYKIHNIGNKMQ